MVKRFLSSARLGKSLLQTRSSPLGSLHTQVTHNLSAISLSNQKAHNNYDFLSSHHQVFHFSTTSKPDCIGVVQLINTKKWCKELEIELEKFHPTLDYEGVMYVLKSLKRNPNKALFFFNWYYNKHDGVKPNPMVYGLMLNILGNKQILDAFAAFTKRLGEDSCFMDHKTHLPVMKKISGVGTAWTQVYNKVKKGGGSDDTLKSVIDVIQGSDSVDDIKKVEVSLSEDSVLRILLALYDFPFKALCFFHWAREGLGYTHNATTYNAILRVLGKKESIEEFWSMVEELKSEGHDIDIDTYEKVVRKFERSEMTKDAVKLYDLMMDSPCKPLVQDFSPCLKDISLAIKDYEETGKALSKGTYDQIYRSLIIMHRFNEAEKVLKTMSDAGYEPDGYTYTQGVLELRKAGRLEDSVKLLNEVESKGYALHKRTWNASIQAHCKAGEVDQALECLTRMLEMNSKVEKQSLEGLVDCLCNNGRVGDAYNTVAEVVDNHNIRPSLLTFQKLIEELLNDKKLEEAMSLLRSMKKHNYPAYQGPYVDYISKFGTVDDALEFLKELGPVKNTSHTSCSHLFELFLKEGRESEAKELFNKSSEHIRKIKSIMNNFTSEKGKEPQHLTGEKESIVDILS